MPDNKKEELALNNEQEEHYSPGYGTELVQSYQRRTVAQEAAFFSPYLHSGMTLIDCGCGPGTITEGLAKLIEPGSVVGIDIERSQIEIAQKHLLEQGISNIQFKVANIYELPFPEASFDSAFVHAVLQHLQNPLKALREINRVLRPGGLIGVRDDDQGGLILAPDNPKMEKLIDLLKKFMRHNGGNPFVGRHHRELLRQAGFINIEATASCEYDGKIETTVKRGKLAAKLVDHMAETAIRLGWADINEMKDLSVTAIEWGEHLDAFDAIIWCEAVGWKV